MQDYENQESKTEHQSKLMNLLLMQKAKFASEEEFKEFALAEVRRFITDLRSLNIELTMRPTFNKIPLSRHSVTEKLAAQQEN